MQREHGTHSLCPRLAVCRETWARKRGTHSGRRVLEETGARGILSRAQPDPTLHPQFYPSMAQQELPVPIYITRGKGQRLDNAHALHGELGDGRAGGTRRVADGMRLSAPPGLP